MSLVDVLGPSLVGVSSSLLVPVGVVNEDSSLLDIAFIVGLLLGSFLGTELFVFGGSKTIGNITGASDLSLLELQPQKSNVIVRTNN